MYWVHAAPSGEKDRGRPGDHGGSADFHDYGYVYDIDVLYDYNGVFPVGRVNGGDGFT